MKFRREEMKTAAAKAALLTSILRADIPPDFAASRYDETKLTKLKEVKFDADYADIGNLKAIPQAMWLWSEALRLRQSCKSLAKSRCFTIAVGKGCPRASRRHPICPPGRAWHGCAT